jgi:hypothetical protein
MPAVSKAQRIAMVIAEHHPEELYARNKGLAKMSKSKLHEFTDTKEKGLPEHVAVKNAKKRLRKVFG